MCQVILWLPPPDRLCLGQVHVAELGSWHSWQGAFPYKTKRQRPDDHVSDQGAAKLCNRFLAMRAEPTQKRRKCGGGQGGQGMRGRAARRAGALDGEEAAESTDTEGDDELLDDWEEARQLQEGPVVPEPRLAAPNIVPRLSAAHTLPPEALSPTMVNDKGYVTRTRHGKIEALGNGLITFTLTEFEE
jgi:hypothetical protein